MAIANNLFYINFEDATRARTQNNATRRSMDNTNGEKQGKRTDEGKVEIRIRGPKNRVSKEIYESRTKAKE